MNIKFVPFYFPQFHEIPENNIWWGNGFTDWQWVKNAKPLFENHYQPRTPARDYYDLSEPAVMQYQIELAQKYKIHGFNFYHYWFDGKLLLQKPVDNFLKQKTDFKFCITWANEAWTRRWIGKVNDVLIEQKHSADVAIWNKHLDYLEKLFTDDRYIKINNKPVFFIYRPDLIHDIDVMMEFYNSRIRKKMGNGIYWIGIKAYESFNNSWEDFFDAILKFEPRYSMNTQKENKIIQTVDSLLRSLPEKIQIPIGELKAKLDNKYKIFDYRKICNEIIQNSKADILSQKKIYQSVFAGWDNTPRYGKRAKIFINTTPENFKFLLENVTTIELQKGNELLFINAWNEWSESAYLEPDIMCGDAYLKVLKDFSDTSVNSDSARN